MKRTRSDNELVNLVEKLVSLERVPKDVIILILTKYNLNVLDINRFCNSSPKLRALCKEKKIWEQIYLKHVPNANIDTWRGQAEWMPNEFLRFIAFYVLSVDDGEYEYKFESPSKEEALVIMNHRIIPKFKMPPNYQENWENQWKVDQEEEGADSDEDMGEMAEMAFNEYFGDENGYVWEYATLFPGGRDRIAQKKMEFGNEIMQLINLNVLDGSLVPKVSTEHVIYTLLILDWKPVYFPLYPDIQCKVCNQATSTMCQECKTPICSPICLADGHQCNKSI